jgi:hypothetical protein
VYLWENKERLDATNTSMRDTSFHVSRVLLTVLRPRMRLLLESQLACGVATGLQRTFILAHDCCYAMFSCLLLVATGREEKLRRWVKR